MCVYTKDWFPKISRKPIKVYKILERNEIFGLVTPFIQQRVEIGKPIKAKIPWHRYDIHVDPYMIMYIIAAEGVHAYTKFAEARANITHSGNPQHIYEAIIDFR